MKKILYCLYLLGIIICISACNNNEAFRKNGILTKGRVAFKYKNSAYRSVRYSFMVYYFTEPGREEEKRNPVKPDTTKKKTIEEILNGLTINPKIGDFLSSEVVVDSYTFDKYNEGDQIEIYYLMGDSIRIQLKEYID